VIERRLKKTHRIIALALHQRGQELQREMQETDEALNESAEAWAGEYGLPDDLNYTIVGKGDGELYLVEQKSPQQEPAPAPIPPEAEAGTDPMPGPEDEAEPEEAEPEGEVGPEEG
jgi:hypothetical protein